MSKWVVILHQSKNEDEDAIRRMVEEVGQGEVVWIGDQRPELVKVTPADDKEAQLDADPRLSRPL
jgi:hypothetical protein